MMIKQAFKVEIPHEIKLELDLIDQVAEDLKMNVFVVGGFPRDIVSGKGLTETTDLDITEELGNGFDLAFFVAAKYGLSEPEIYESSGTAMVTMPSGRVVEFHNAYHNVPHIIDQLYSMDIEPSPLNKDIYSRDFTINTLLFDPKTKDIIDLTGKAIEDIRNKILRTPLEPRKTLSINPKIILRGIRFKLEMGLEEDPEYTKAVPEYVPWLISFLENNPDSKMVQRTVKKIYDVNPQRAMEEFRKLGILDYLPKNVNLDKSIKKEFLGINISPQSLSKENNEDKKEDELEVNDIVIRKTSNDDRIIVSQTSMIRHLMEERDKHKEYIKRKRREEKEKRRKKVDILEKARTGWFMENEEQPNFKKKRKYMGIPGREYVPKKRR